jgi:hypothetical protein
VRTDKRETSRTDAGTTIDVRTLRTLYTKNEAARAVLDHFAERLYSSKATTADRLRIAIRQSGHDLSRSQAIEFFKALEAANCGRFKVGRKGHPSRFEWTASLITVGQAATGEISKVEELSAVDPGLVMEEENSIDFVDHRYWLRPGEVEVSIRLPKDLSMTEATRFAEYVRTLPTKEPSPSSPAPR